MKTMYNIILYNIITELVIIYRYLAVFGGIWRYLAVFGGIWRYLAVFGGIWRYLAVLGGIGRYWAVLGGIGRYWAVLGGIGRYWAVYAVPTVITRLFESYNKCWLKGSNIPLQIKIILYDSLVASVMLYNCNSWAVPDKDLEKLDTTHRMADIFF